MGNPHEYFEKGTYFFGPPPNLHGNEKNLEIPSVNSEESNTEGATYEQGKRTMYDHLKGNFGRKAIKRIKQYYAINSIETVEKTLKSIEVPMMKALNMSHLSNKEYTRLWLARLGQPDLKMLRDMQNKQKACFFNSPCFGGGARRGRGGT